MSLCFIKVFGVPFFKKAQKSPLPRKANKKITCLLQMIFLYLQLFMRLTPTALIFNFAGCVVEVVETKCACVKKRI